MSIPPVLKGSRRRLFIVLVVNGLGQAFFNICTVLLVRYAFDRFITEGKPISLEPLLWTAMGLIAVTACMALLRMAERVDAEQMGQEYTHRIRMMLFRHMSRLAPRSLQKRSRGSLVLRFVGDLNAIRRWVSLGLVRVSVAGFTTAGTLAAMFFINPVIAAGIAVILAAGAFLAFRFGNRIQDTARESRRKRSHLAANINEKVSSMAVVQVFGQSDREYKRVKRQSSRLKDAMIEHARQIGLIRALTQCVMAMASGVVVFLGIGEVAAGRATPGTVVAAITIVGLLVPAIRDLGRVCEYWHESRVSFQKIEEFLMTPSLVKEMRGAPDLETGPGQLVFKNAALKGVLKNINAVAHPGQVVAVIGSNGSGKSTLLSLASRFIDPKKGEVLLDGQNIKRHSLASLRQAIGVVSPDLPLMRGKIDKNIRYRWPDAPEEEVKRVMSLCEIDTILDGLKDGARTRLIEGGQNLSLGQRQRIALARSLLGNPRILLLDEADVHMDRDTSALLDRILADYKGTVLFVTHNIERIEGADMVWKMEHGRIIAQGTPEQVFRPDPREQETAVAVEKI
jgi:ATP-binding cassette subfamily B protein/subfamily B ATP-binding cassette protein MsbA